MGWKVHPLWQTLHPAAAERGLLHGLLAIVIFEGSLLTTGFSHPETHRSPAWARSSWAWIAAFLVIRFVYPGGPVSSARCSAFDLAA